jgi:hypothetical protein
MSDEDIGSGARWNDEIAKSLDETDFGIVCVTRANQHAPWLIFEAGALAKSVKKARVVPLCVDLPQSDITGPLAAFQGRVLDEDGLKRLVQDVNEAAEKKVAPDELDDVFAAMWPRVEAAIDKAVDEVQADKEPKRSIEDMLAEVVDTVRRTDRRLDIDLVDGR